MKKLFLLFVAFVATTSLWAYDFQSGDLYYNITRSFVPYTVAVTNQGEWSSYNYSGLTTATIPEAVTYNGTTYSVTGIGDYAFYGCLSLTSITIPNSVTSIEGSAFYGCSSLTSIVIPHSVTSIGWGAFFNCSSLSTITIPESVTSIGDRAFYGCSSLTSVTIPYNGVPNSVSIGESAFSYCTSLTSITIPNSIISIGTYAFYGCSSLADVICKSIAVPRLESDVFFGMPISEATLYVPVQSLEKYKAAAQWKEFGSIVPLEETPNAVDNILSSSINTQKIMRNGQLIILRDGVEYNAMGAEIH